MPAACESKRADDVLSWKPGLPLAIVEAKDNKEPVGGGMQQALLYADTLDVPFVYASNGDGFIEHDRMGTATKPERFLSNNEFPSPDELWRRYCKAKGIAGEAERIVARVEHLMKFCDDIEAKLRTRDDKAAKLAEALVAELVNPTSPSFRMGPSTF